MKKIILIALLFVSAAACGISHAEKRATQTQVKINVSDTQTTSAQMISPCNDNAVFRVVWDTSGGGDMRFVIDKDEAGYRLHVERYDFEAVDQEISLADANTKVQHVIDVLFTWPRQLIGYRYDPQELTGTWTTITVVCVDNQEIPYDFIAAWRRPWDDLYLYVDQAMQAIEPAP